MKKLSERFKYLILSIFLYNEWRGYTQLEAELIPELEADPRCDPRFLVAVKKHAEDEKKHYQMLKAYFLSTGSMPFAVRKSVGYFDTLVRWVVKDCQRSAIRDERRFAKLCCAIVTTELRGIKQVTAMLGWRLILSDDRLKRIFQMIREDEPSHFLPYQQWLEEHGYRGPSFLYKLTDCAAHYMIAVIVIPMHFFNFMLKRMTAFEDSGQFT